MADNFLERQYDDYLRAKAKKERARRLAWQKRLKAYKASQQQARGDETPGKETP